MGQEGKSPAVSVIMPAYRVTEYIAEALDSVLAQTFTDYEIVVINDGCPDTSALEQVLEPYRGRIVYIKKDNGGLASARNAGIAVSSAPLVALLDADDVWTPDFLAVQVGMLQTDPSIDVLYANGTIFGDSPVAGRMLMDLNPSDGEVTFESLLTLKCTVVASTVTARKEVFLRAGGFDEGLRRVEDFDLWLRVLKSGGRIAYHRKPLLRYRRHGTSLSANSVAMRQTALAVLDKAERTLSLTSAELDALNVARLRYQADADYFSGTRALSLGDVTEAIRGFEAANVYNRRLKLTILVFLLKTFPRLTLAVVKLRGGMG
jgi:glycosyltransferase involved in cell wall biosynthesis